MYEAKHLTGESPTRVARDYGITELFKQWEERKTDGMTIFNLEKGRKFCLYYRTS